MASLQGERQLQARFTAISGQQGGRAMMQMLGMAAVAEQKLLVARKTGNTARTIRLAQVTARSAITTAAGAALFLEDGTKAHTITPRAARALRFAAPGVGTTLAGRVRTGEVRRLGKGAYVFSKVVHHPGTKPKPFMLPGARAAVSKAGLGEFIVRRWNSAS